MYFSTLYFFDLEESYSKTERACKSGPCSTTYYNSQNEKIGTSETWMESASGPCHTTYYDKDRKKIGTSYTDMSMCASGPCNTTFKNNNDVVIGTSKTDMSRSVSGPCETFYFDRKQEKIGRSYTTMFSASSSFTTRFTLRAVLQIASEASPKHERSELKYPTTSNSTYVFDLKRCYLSNGGSTAACNDLFKVNENEKLYKFGDSRDSVINKMKLRAFQNPGGASDKTLTHFNLYSEEELQQRATNPSIYQLKAYYKTQACYFFNAIKTIFANNREASLEILKQRANENPGGASEKTLLHFHYVKPNTNPSIPQLKSYYLKQAGYFFNASDTVFFKTYNRRTIIQTLKERARKNPDGASQKTLNYFKIK